jgi:hypothetical protein
MNVCNIIGNVAAYCSGFRDLLLQWQHFANLGRRVRNYIIDSILFPLPFCVSVCQRVVT